ncbi:MAG: PIG-L deacetylase family protein [Thermoplasmata archaeon]
MSAHTDDMELGAGATARYLVESGAKVKSVVFSDCKKSVDTTKYPEDILRKECTAAADHLGIDDLTILEFPVRELPNHRQEILEYIYQLRTEAHYDLVLTSWQGDLHQDHRVVAEETLRAFMKQETTILSYPIPGNCPDFTPQVYVPVDADSLEKKITMLHKYESQVVSRGYLDKDAIKGWMAYFGVHVGVPFAEAFLPQKTVISGFIKN